MTSHNTKLGLEEELSETHIAYSVNGLEGHSLKYGHTPKVTPKCELVVFIDNLKERLNEREVNSMRKIENKSLTDKHNVANVRREKLRN